MTTQNDTQTTVGVGVPFVQELRTRSIAQAQTAWEVIKNNKLRVFLTIVLLLTVIGAIGALYLWRRELTELVATAIEKILALVRGDRFRGQELVMVGQPVPVDGTQQKMSFRDTDDFFAER